MNRIRRRTIPFLVKLGVKHDLVLLETKGLFDSPHLRIVNPSVDQLKKAIDYFRTSRWYKVKVSGMGHADVLVTTQNLYVFLD